MIGDDPIGQHRLRLAIVTNIPAPYRVPVYNEIARDPGICLCAFYAARSEPDRQWDLPPLEHEHRFMRGTVRQRQGRYIHNNPEVWRALRDFNPDVVVTTGFNPTHLMAWLFALLKQRKHVVMTDGTNLSEQSLSRLHRAVRRVVFATSQSFVVASNGGKRLLHSYGVVESLIHQSPLCANTAVSWQPSGGPRDIDLLFSGRLVALKNATFALQVAQGAAERLGRRISLAVLGDGPEGEALHAQAQAMSADVDVQFAGHVTQAEVPRWFQRARLFLFPTRWDPWGVVANEACVAAVPVLVSPHAGVAGELVRDKVNGRVLELDLATWIDAVVGILADPKLQAKLAAAAVESVRFYSFANAADGITAAARQSLQGRSVETQNR